MISFRSDSRRAPARFARAGRAAGGWRGCIRAAQASDQQLVAVSDSASLSLLRATVRTPQVHVRFRPCTGFPLRFGLGQPGTGSIGIQRRHAVQGRAERSAAQFAALPSGGVLRTCTCGEVWHWGYADVFVICRQNPLPGRADLATR